ncbi:hypothetical protein G3I40_13180 [Streptomyces sp. SID14478]|uniref:hypothetical protein n=1 Tax=Streptomyces sp. SID14478 TaxID=2706073 RepID=UPI0013DCE8C8|nr:hypothetical protein [Streptomyces sp. SID14478]NEB76165.1 hypothetical protein [Streptomyces sp. SID14478]
MIGWMRHAPRGAVVLALAVAAGMLCVGAVAHVTDLLRHGLHPYPAEPAWLNLYWTCLAALDPLVGALLIAGRRPGVALACAVMTTDLAANWYAVYSIQHSDVAAQPGLQRLIAFALLVLATAPYLYRRLPR